MGKLYVPIRRSVYLTLGAINNMVPFLRTHVFILCYHSISNDIWPFGVSLATFKKQINYLIEQGYQIIPMSELALYCKGKAKLTKPSVVITFDDGYQDVLHAKEFLQKKGIRPTIFLLSDTDHANRKELATDRPFLTKKEIRSLVKAGWEIGSHTATHANMDTLTDDEITEEIINSKEKIEKMLTMKVPYLAYPKGRYSQKILNAVAKAKYTLALTMDDGTLLPGIPLYQIPRIGVDRTHSFQEFTVLSLPLVAKVRGFIKSIIL